MSTTGVSKSYYTAKKDLFLNIFVLFSRSNIGKLNEFKYLPNVTLCMQMFCLLNLGVSYQLTPTVRF